MCAYQVRQAIERKEHEREHPYSSQYPLSSPYHDYPPKNSI